MPRHLLIALVITAFAASTVSAQSGPLQRVGQALDRAGKTIRSDVEGAVARGQTSAQERELLNRISQRINWDKQVVNSTIQLVVAADGTIYLRGSVRSDAAKARVVDLAESTIGVTRVVDELAVVKTIKVTAPPTVHLEQVITAPPAQTITAPLPTESEVLVKP